MHKTSIFGLVTLLSAPLFAHANAATCPARTTDRLDVQGSTLCLLSDDTSPPRRQLLYTWVERSAHIVTDYYGRFPAPLVVLRLPSTEGPGVGGGRTTNDSGLAIRVSVGRGATSAGLSDDWVLVHMKWCISHCPKWVDGTIGWRKALATYVEGIARAQFGNREIADVWAEYRHSMPIGLPPRRGRRHGPNSDVGTYLLGAGRCIAS